MNDADVVAAITDERLRLAELFASLTPAQLATSSLCAGWSVKHVAAHLTMLFNVSGPRLMFRVLGEQLSFDRAIDGITQQMATRPIDGIVRQLRDFAGDRRHPPGRAVAPLADLIVHGEDVRRPLGITRDYPFERVDAALRFVTAGRAIGFVPASRIRGLRFVATDRDGTWGVGNAIVHGPALSLLLGIMGRRIAFADLGGAVRVLQQRVDPPPKGTATT